MPIAEDPNPSPSTEEPDPFADLVLDEQFVKSATIKEPSGRARILTARWKRRPPPEAESWRPPTEIRRRRFQRRAKVVDPWGNLKRKPHRNWQTPVFILLASAVVLAGLNVDRLRGWYSGNQNSGTAAAPAEPKAAPTTQAPETAAPTAAPPTQAPDLPTVAHPWAGSPAESWPAGADAIVVPAAQAVGVFGQDQVAKRLESVKAFLVATNLDPQVVAGGTPQAALDQLDPKLRDKLAQRLAHPTDLESPLSYVSRIDPRDALLIGDVIKVQGRMSFESDGEKGVLVHTDFTFVYPLRPGPEAGRRRTAPSPTDDAAPAAVSWTVRQAGDVSGTTVSTRTTVRREETFRFYNPAKYAVHAGTVWIEHSTYDPFNSSCDTSDGFFHPGFPQIDLNPGGPQPSGPTSDPYDRSKPIPDGTGVCGTSSRT